MSFKNPLKLLTGPLSAGEVVQATPTPRRRDSSPTGAVAGRRGVGVSQHHTIHPTGEIDALIASVLKDDQELREVTELFAPVCQVVDINQLRAARARRLSRAGHWTGGAA